jgi:hypothetical protein
MWCVKVVQPRCEVLWPCGDNGEALQDIYGDCCTDVWRVPQPCADNGKSTWPLYVNGKVSWPRGEVLRPHSDIDEAAQLLVGNDVQQGTTTSCGQLRGHNVARYYDLARTRAKPYDFLTSTVGPLDHTVAYDQIYHVMWYIISVHCTWLHVTYHVSSFIIQYTIVHIISDKYVSYHMSYYHISYITCIIVCIIYHACIASYICIIMHDTGKVPNHIAQISNVVFHLINHISISQLIRYLSVLNQISYTVFLISDPLKNIITSYHIFVWYSYYTSYQISRIMYDIIYCL